VFKISSPSDVTTSDVSESLLRSDQTWDATDFEMKSLLGEVPRNWNIVATRVHNGGG